MSGSLKRKLLYPVEGKADLGVRLPLDLEGFSLDLVVWTRRAMFTT